MRYTDLAEGRTALHSHPQKIQNLSQSYAQIVAAAFVKNPLDGPKAQARLVVLKRYQS